MTFQENFKNNSQNMVFFKNNSRTKKIQEQFKEFENEWPPWLTTILISILDYFQEKLMKMFFKNQKNPTLGPLWPLILSLYAA